MTDTTATPIIQQLHILATILCLISLAACLPVAPHGEPTSGNSGYIAPHPTVPARGENRARLSAAHPPTMYQPTATPAVCTVTAWALTVRTGPGVDYDPVAWLRAGDTVTITGQPVNNWQPITTPDGLTGWVNSNFLECAK